MPESEAVLVMQQHRKVAIAAAHDAIEAWIAKYPLRLSLTATQYWGLVEMVATHMQAFKERPDGR